MRHKKAKPKARPKFKPKPKHNAAFNVLVLLLFVTVGATATLGFAAYSAERDSARAEAILSIVDTDEIYENIYINGIKVGGLTKTEAYDKLFDIYQKPVNEKTISLTDDAGNKYELPFTRFNAKYDINSAVEAAHAYGRGVPLNERYGIVASLLKRPYELTVGYTFSESLVSNALTVIAAEIDVEPVNASITRLNRQFYTTYSETGRRLDVEKTAGEILPLVASAKSGSAELIIETVYPEYTEENFITAQDLIGSFQTSFSPGNNGRDTNLQTAADKINDVVVYPDDIFSTNDAFGDMTYENGYRMAPVITDGKIEDGMGGGICQVSSTLYNALLHAEVEIVERRNHSLKVAYADYGFDATLVEGVIDLKFKNDTEYPLFIESYIDGARVVVNIYGHEIHPPGRNLKFENELVETVEPAEEILTETENLPYGETETVTAAKNGYRYNVYKTIYDNEKEIGRELVNRSYYRPVRAEINVGTGPVTEFPYYEREPGETPYHQEQPYETPEPSYEPPQANETPEPYYNEPPVYEAPEPIITPPEEIPGPYKNPDNEIPDEYKNPDNYF